MSDNDTVISNSDGLKIKDLREQGVFVPTVVSTDYKQMHFETGLDISAIETAATQTEPDYAVCAKRLQNVETVRLLHAAIGLVTEAGELLDVLKKYIFYGKPMDQVNYIEEIGDASWYLRIGAAAADTSLMEAMMLNVRKLRARFPNQFVEQDAIYRNLPLERSILEEGVIDANKKITPNSETNS